MAHTICRNVIWQNSKLGGMMEGNGEFRIDEHADAGSVPITGRHDGRGGLPLIGRCNGEVLSFALIDSNTNQMIGYLKGRYRDGGAKHFLNGKFVKLELSEAVSGTVAILADDWEADKTT